MLNRAMLVGRLVRDVELRNSVNGKPFVAFTLAVNSAYSNNQTSFIPCFAWNRTAENMAKFLKKGSLIALDGKIQTKNDNVNGQVTTQVFVVADNVTFLDSRNTNMVNNPNDEISIEGIQTPGNFDFDNITTFGGTNENKQSSNENDITFDGDDAILWD